MQVWTMSDVGSEFVRQYQKQQKSSNTPDLRFSVMGASSKHGKQGTRMRFAMDIHLWKFISAGLHDPRINVHGDAAHGLKIFCKDGEGWKPIINKHATSLIVNAAPFKVTPHHVASMRVEFVQEQEDNGPVIRVPRLPDDFLPAKVLDKLPASQLDPKTLEDRKQKAKEKRMDRASDAFDLAFGLADPYAPPHDENPGTSEVLTPPAEEPEPAPEPQPTPKPEPVEPPAEIPEKVQAVAVHVPQGYAPDEHDQSVEDLKAAIAMVNEYAGALGDAVILYVDGEGKLKAKRRVVVYQDL